MDPDGSVLTDEQWVAGLAATAGPGRDEHVARLHALMVRAARHQLGRMAEASSLGAARRDEVVHSAADEATMSVLDRLGTFEGRSRFTTWAYKFAILQTAVEVRRVAWRTRHVELGDARDVATGEVSPVEFVEGIDLAAAVRDGLTQALTAYQRQVAIALLVDGVPIDVLAERLGTSRGAIYKTVHEARKRLRAYLATRGHDPERTSSAAMAKEAG